MFFGTIRGQPITGRQVSFGPDASGLPVTVGIIVLSHETSRDHARRKPGHTVHVHQ